MINQDEENIKTEETTISSSSSKKFKRKKNNMTFAKINYNINNNLSSIKEEKNNNSENDSFFLLEDNIKKEKETEKYITIEDTSTEKENNIDENSNNLNKEKGGYKYPKEKKEENYIDLDITDIRKYCYKNREKNEEEINNKNKSRKNSKNIIDLKFLDEEEKEEEKISDYKIYIQKAYDEDEIFKIIYQFNKLPFKPKIEIIDLSIFDNTSILKCVSKCYFEKEQQKFILKLFFIYISESNNNIKEINQKIFDLLEKEENSLEENNTQEDSIELMLNFKRFKIPKGVERHSYREGITLKKTETFEKFNVIKEINENEDLSSYLNYRQIFYILTIQKKKFLRSKKFFTPEKIGIQNEGNTCYMNSIIQSLYNNPFILKKIMQIDVDKNEILLRENNDIHKEVISALQSIFYNLYFQKKAIKILEIFYAFNWKRNFWNSPQDAEEIYIMIFEIISRYNNDIKENCEGILENTIEVEKIEYKSTKEENFFFMQLDIEKNNSVEECLEHFFEKEKLSGDNKYQYINKKGEKILYDAEKYYKFKKIPNFLFIQLKRFTFDMNTYTFDKKNKAISYREEIDLTKYINENGINKEIYILYCILIHSGSAENGHYYCIAKDFKNKAYIKYNDTSIFTAEKKEVFNQLFGGEEIEYNIKNINKDKEEPFYEVVDIKKEIKKNAYILIYVKKNEIKNLFNEDNIKELFDSYKEKIKIKKEEDKENDDNINETLDKYICTYDNDNNTKSYKNKSNNYKLEKKIIYPKKEKGLYKYADKNNKEILKHQKLSNKDINMGINSFSFESINSDLNKLCNYKASNSKKRNKQFYNYVGDNSYNSKKIYDKCPSFSDYKLNDNKVNYYLIPDISTRIKGAFLLKYNTKIFVKDIIPLIQEQLTYQKNTDNIQNYLDDIIKSEGYKLALINAFGIIIKFLDDINDDITPLLNQNSPEKINHLCLYNLSQINISQKINNIISVHFMNKSTFDYIIKKNRSIFTNNAYDKINVPAFIINENISDKNDLIDKIKDLYVNYFGNKAEKNVKFKIYIITEADIINLDILNMTFKELDSSSYFLYLVDYDSPEKENTYILNQYNLKRIIVAI